MAQGVAYSLEVRAEACALVILLGSYAKAAAALGEKMGDLAPNSVTILRWLQKMQPDAFSALQAQRKEALASQWVDLEEMSLEKLIAAVMSGEMSGQTLANMAGISADKRFRLEEIKSRGGGGDLMASLTAMMMREEKTMLADGSSKTTTTKALIAAEGEMP